MDLQPPPLLATITAESALEQCAAVAFQLPDITAVCVRVSIQRAHAMRSSDAPWTWRAPHAHCAGTGAMRVDGMAAEDVHYAALEVAIEQRGATDQLRNKHLLARHRRL